MNNAMERLDADTECDLARQLEAGVYAQYLLDQGSGRLGLGQIVRQGAQARERLWLANTGLVAMLARRYGRRDPDIEADLVQEGQLALADCLMRYDWRRGWRLSTMAWHWIKHRMVKVMTARSHWEHRTTPARDQLAEHVAVSVPDADPDLGALLSCLDGQMRRVLVVRSKGLTQREAARELGMGVVMVRRLERRALQLVRVRTGIRPLRQNGDHGTLRQVSQLDAWSTAAGRGA